MSAGEVNTWGIIPNMFRGSEVTHSIWELRVQNHIEFFLHKAEQRVSLPLPPHQAGTAWEGPHQTLVLQYLDLKLPHMQIYKKEFSV